MSDKDKAREYAVETIAHLASCTPSIRENFWINFTTEEIENIQISFYDKAEDIVVQIEEGKKDSKGFSRHLYSNPLLIKAPPSKMQGALKDMQIFFTDMAERIQRSIIYAGIDIQIAGSEPVMASEEFLRKAGVDIQNVKRKALEKRQSEIDQINKMMGDTNA